MKEQVKLKVLLVNRFYGSGEVPTGRMLADVAKRLASAGCRVEVLCGPGKYSSEIVQVSEEARMIQTYGPKNSSQLFGWFFFWIQAVLVVPFRKWDLCILLTDPPFLCVSAPMAKFVNSKRIMVSWTMDLYPEAIIADKRASEGGIVSRLLRSINEFCYRYIDGLIVLGPKQAERLGCYRSCSKLSNSTIIIPPWDDRPIVSNSDEIKRLKEFYNWQEKRIMLYAGNLGRGHSYLDVIEAARLSNEKNLNWVFAFFCRGVKRKELTEMAMHLPNVVVADYVPQQKTAALLHSASVHLITMCDGWEGVVVPSKLYGILQTNAPVLFIGPCSADTSVEITGARLGHCLENNCGGEAVLDSLERLSNFAPTVSSKTGEGASRVVDFVLKLVVKELKIAKPVVEEFGGYSSPTPTGSSRQ